MAAYKQQVRQTASAAAAFLGAQGVIVVEEGAWTIRVHDGATPGGFRIPTLVDLVANYANLNSPNFQNQISINGFTLQLGANVDITAPFVASAYTDTTNAANITSGTLALARLPTGIANANLANPSVTISGHNLVLGGALNLAAGDISGLAASSTTDTTNASNISSGTLALARLPALAAANLTNGVSGTGNVVLQNAPIIAAPSISSISGNSGCTGTFSSNTSGVPIVQQAGNPGILANNGTSNIIALTGAQMARVFACNFINGSPITQWTEATVLWDGISIMTFANVANGSGGGIALQQSGTSGTIQVKNTTGGNINLLWRAN